MRLINKLISVVCTAWIRLPSVLGGVALIVSVNESSRFYRKQNLSVTQNYHGVTFYCPAGLAMPPNGPAVGFSKRYPTQHPITIQLPRTSGARKLSRCKEGTAWFLPSGCKFYRSLRVSRYKFNRSQKTVQVQNGC